MLEYYDHPGEVAAAFLFGRLLHRFQVGGFINA
jgi:hypothetical protein